MVRCHEKKNVKRNFIIVRTSPICHRISLHLDNTPRLPSQKKTFSLLWVKRQISLMRAGCDYAFRKEQQKKSRKKEKWGGGNHDKSPTLLKFLHPGAGCAPTCLCFLWVRLSTLRARVKTNLPGVIQAEMDENHQPALHCQYEWGKFAWEFPFFSKRTKKKRVVDQF